MAREQRERKVERGEMDDGRKERAERGRQRRDRKEKQMRESQKDRYRERHITQGNLHIDDSCTAGTVFYCLYFFENLPNTG